MLIIRLPERASLSFSASAFELRPLSGSYYDVSAILLAENGKARSSDDIVFYGQPEHSQGCLYFHRNVPPFKRNDLYVDLNKVDDTVEKIVFVMSFYSDYGKKNPEANSEIVIQFACKKFRDGEQLFCLRLPNSPDANHAVIVGDLTRWRGDWIFTANGERCEGGLDTICDSFGINAVWKNGAYHV